MRPYEVTKENQGIRIQRNPNHPRIKIKNKLKEKPLKSMSKPELVELVENYIWLNNESEIK